MKKLLAFVLLFGIISCSTNEVPSHLLIDNGGVFYEVGSKKPFDGTSIENQEGKLYKKTYFSEGKIIKIEEFYKSGFIKRVLVKENDEFLANVFDEEGNDISNKVINFYYPNGLLKEEGRYVNGRKDGSWKSYNEEGNFINIDFWDFGKELPIKNIKSLYFNENIAYEDNDALSSKSPFTGIVKINPGDNGYDSIDFLTYIKVIDGKRANLEEQYLPDTHELIYQSNCNLSGGGKAEFDMNTLTYWDDDYSLEECEETWYFDEFPTKIRGKDKLYLSDDGEWIYENFNFYSSGQILSFEKSIVGKKDSKSSNIDRVGNILEIQKNYKDGSPHTETTIVNNEKIFKRYNKDGLDISNGEAIGIELSLFSNESWFDEENLLQGFYKNGLREGEWKRPNGTRLHTYKDGKKNGPYLAYLTENDVEDGCLWESGSYIDNRKHGEWLEYYTYPDEMCGAIEEITIYDMGKEVNSVRPIEDSGLIKKDYFDLFVLRVHLLSSENNAKKMVSQINKGGFPAFFEIDSDTKLYGVYVGPFIEESDITDNIDLIQKVSKSNSTEISRWEL